MLVTPPRAVPFPNRIDKGTPGESRGRKAMGLPSRRRGSTVARPPNAIYCVEVVLVFRFTAALAAALVVIGIAAAAPRGHAQAFDAWCADDPIISVNGNLVDVQVQMPLANLLTMRSTSLTIVVPRNVSGSVVLDDVSAFPMHTTISATGKAWNGVGSVPITIDTYVSASSTYTTKVVATPVLNLSNLLASPSSTSGWTNELFALSMGIGR